MASAEPYASYLHFATEDNHVSISSLRFLRARCSSWHPSNSVKARINVKSCRNIHMQYVHSSVAAVWTPWVCHGAQILRQCVPGLIHSYHAVWTTSHSCNHLDFMFCFHELTLYVLTSSNLCLFYDLLLLTALAIQVMQSPPSVRLSLIPFMNSLSLELTYLWLWPFACE